MLYVKDVNALWHVFFTHSEVAGLTKMRFKSGRGYGT